MEKPASQYSGMPAGMKLILAGAMITLMFVGIYQIRDIFAPAFFALTLVLTVRPIHRWLTNKGLPSWVAAVATLTTLAVTLLGILGLMAWSLVGLPDLVMSYSSDFQGYIDQIMTFLQDRGFATDQITEQIMGMVNVSQALNTLLTAASSVTSVGGLFFLIVLALLFITVDTMTLKYRSRIVMNHDSFLYDALANFEGRVRQYWLVSTTFGLIVAIINGIVLELLHVPMPVAWALFSFITNYIPNIGFVIGVIPPALFGALSEGWPTGVWVIVAYSIINAGIQGVIQPKITGDAVGLSTVVTFLSLLFWTSVIGPFGAILAVPLTLFFKALLVDSSPQTRWMGAFLVPESEAEKGLGTAYYDENASKRAAVVATPSKDTEQGKRIRSTLRNVTLRKPDERVKKSVSADKPAAAQPADSESGKE